MLITLCVIRIILCRLFAYLGRRGRRPLQLFLTAILFGLLRKSLKNMPPQTNNHIISISLVFVLRVPILSPEILYHILYYCQGLNFGCSRYSRYLFACLGCPPLQIVIYLPFGCRGGRPRPPVRCVVNYAVIHIICTIRSRVRDVGDAVPYGL